MNVTIKKQYASSFVLSQKCLSLNFILFNLFILLNLYTNAYDTSMFLQIDF